MARERLGTYNINESREVALPALDELSGIVFLPLLPVLTQVTLEGLVAPGALRRVGDRSPGADTLVLAGVLEEQSQCTMSTHRVARDRNSRGINLLKLLEDEVGKLIGDIRLHLVVLAVRVLLGIDVEARSAAKVI